jgi:Sulfotransferase family
MSGGPDFIGVGMPKAGTGWLYDQLEAHPDFWMPPVKELVYLTQKFPRMHFVDEHAQPRVPRRERSQRNRNAASPRASQNDRLIQRPLCDRRDIEFLRYASSCRGQAMSLDRYAGLFSFKGGQLSGDITPPYCNLDDEMVRRVAEYFPRTKIILLVRDPVARAWSRICMSHEAGRFDTALLEDAERFRMYIKGSHKLGAVFASEVYRRWRREAPAHRFGFFFFDDLVNRPDHLRQEILLFLGADPDKKSGELPADYNRKAQAAKLELTPGAKAVLVDYFADEIRACADTFGGHAVDWAASYGV